MRKWRKKMVSDEIKEEKSIMTVKDKGREARRESRACVRGKEDKEKEV